MATTKSRTKKRSSKQVIRVKKKSKSSFSNKRTAIIFLLVFGVVAGGLLLRSWASPLIKPSLPPNNLVINYSESGATAAELKNGKWVYKKLPLQVQVLNTGEVRCNNGSGDSVNTGQISKNSIRAISAFVSRGLKTIPDDFIGIPGSIKDSTIIINPVNIAVADDSGNLIKTVTVDRAAKRPAVFKALESYLRHQCKKVSKRTELSALSPLTPIKTKDNGVWTKVSNFVTPKVMAAGANHNPHGELASWNAIQYHRGGDPNGYGAWWPHPLNKPPLRGLTCLTLASIDLSLWDLAGGTYDSKGRLKLVHTSDLIGFIEHYCGGGETMLGENLGWGRFGKSVNATTAGDAITKGMLADIGIPDLGHHQNIDSVSLNFHDVGVGAASKPHNSTTYEMFVTQEFATYPNK